MIEPPDRTDPAFERRGWPPLTRNGQDVPPLELALCRAGEVHRHPADRLGHLDRSLVGLEPSDPGSMARRKDLGLLPDSDRPPGQRARDDGAGALDREYPVEELAGASPPFPGRGVPPPDVPPPPPPGPPPPPPGATRGRRLT